MKVDLAHLGGDPDFDRGRDRRLVVAAVLLFFIDTIAYKLMVDWLPSVWGKL